MPQNMDDIKHIPQFFNKEHDDRRLKDCLKYHGLPHSTLTPKQRLLPYEAVMEWYSSSLGFLGDGFLLNSLNEVVSQLWFLLEVRLSNSVLDAPKPG